MTRSNWKNLNISKTIIKKIRKKLLKRPVRNKFIFNGSVSIPILFEDMTFYIYNGKMFNSFTVDYLTQNKKFGEFSTTRKPFFFSKKKKKR